VSAESESLSISSVSWKIVELTAVKRVEEVELERKDEWSW